MAKIDPGVNFIPDEVVQTRKREYRKKSGNKGALGLLILVGVISGGIYGYNFYLNQQIQKANTEISQHEASISALKDFAEKGYRVGVRLSESKNVLDSRLYFSKLAAELSKRVPSSVIITEVDMNETGTITVKGTATPNYTPVADFKDALLSDTKEQGTIFKDVQIKSANIVEDGIGIEFVMDVVINSASLTDQVAK